MTRRAPRGFTLLEVMLGLALLGFGLVVLIKSTTGNMTNAKSSQLLGVVTDLSRAKMYDIEEKLAKEGFTDTDQSECKEFDDEGWPDIEYCVKVEPVELPSLDALVAIQQQRASGSGSGAGSGADGEAEGDPGDLGVLSSVVGMFGGAADDKAGAGFIQSFYPMVQEALKASVRKVTLTVKYQVLGEDRELVTVAVFTEPSGMDKAIPFGAPLPDGASGTDGGGSGSNRGSGGVGGGVGTPGGAGGIRR